jgi:hypothetical protein
MTNVTMHHATQAKYERLVAMFAAEYPALHISPIGNEIGKLTHFVTFHSAPSDDSDGSEIDTPLMTTKKVPELADVFAACEDADVDPEALEVEETKRNSSSVVDTMYKSQYKEQSTNGQTCGDWLAEWLVTHTTVGGKLDIEALHALFSANGLDLTAKWALVYDNEAKQSRGWTGRYRMSGRIALEKVVAKTGKAIDHNGLSHDADADFLTTLRAKHAKWLAKEAKMQATADAFVEEQLAS